MTRTYSHTQSTSSPAAPKNSNTPGRRPKSQTPSRSSATPSQAYAGPLFHASPAASALPIPKWFSKTISERKARAEETIGATTAKQLSPNQSDESPTLRKFRMDAKQLSDENAPKFHMPPDRAEKGKWREGKAMPASVNEDSFISPSLSASTLVGSSASPDADRPHYPGHQINDSSQEIFPWETEDSSDSSIPKQGSRLLRNLSESALPSTVPSVRSAQTEDEEKRRKAQSVALKKLLQTKLLETPVPQRPVSASSHLRTTTNGNRPRVFQPARNSSAPFSFMDFPDVNIPSLPYGPYLSSSYPHYNTPESLEAAQQSSKATQLSTPYYKPDTFDGLKKYNDFDEVGVPYPRTEKRPLSYGHRAVLMEGYLSRGTSFESRPCITSSQFSKELDKTHLTCEERAKLLEDYIQRRGSSCSCKSGTCSPQSSSSVESTSPKDDDRTKRMKDYLGRGETFKPALSSSQSFPGADSMPVVETDPDKMWLDNHLRNEILKIGDAATEVAT